MSEELNKTSKTSFKVRKASIEELMQWSLACQNNDKETITLIEPAKGEIEIVDPTPDKYGNVLCRQNDTLIKLSEYNAKRHELINRIDSRIIYISEEDKNQQIEDIKKLYELERLPIFRSVGEVFSGIIFKKVDGVNILYCMKPTETKFVKDTFVPIVTNRPCGYDVVSDHVEFRGPLHLLLALISAPIVFVFVTSVNIKERMQLVRNINKVKKASIEKDIDEGLGCQKKIGRR